MTFSLGWQYVDGLLGPMYLWRNAPDDETAEHVSEHIRAFVKKHGEDAGIVFPQNWDFSYVSESKDAALCVEIFESMTRRSRTQYQ